MVGPAAVALPDYIRRPRKGPISADRMKLAERLQKGVDFPKRVVAALLPILMEAVVKPRSDLSRE